MIWLVAVIALLVVATEGQIVNDVTSTINDIIDRGERLSYSTLDRRGIVQDSMRDLLDQAASVLGEEIDEDAYLIGRVVRSEQGGSNVITRARVGAVVINQSRSSLFGSISAVVLYHKDKDRNGHLGKQIGGRFASTEDPFESDYRIGQWVLSNDDPTEGATNFVNRSAFASQEGATSYESFRVTMAQEGKVPGIFPDDSGTDLVFFWRGSVPSIAVEI